MKWIIKSLQISALVVLVTACAPRGENQSVDEVLNSQARTFKALNYADKVRPEINKNLGEIATKLETLSSGKISSEVGTLSTQIAVMLTDLTNHAGYTSRPAMTELVNQYRSLSQDHESRAADQGALKLLVARTYSLLSSELETTKFSL